jgi:DNA mismatch repair protein MutS
MGESTFMVEMKETASILRAADPQSFILLDEIGRGTSTEDGLAIAHAVLDYLHDDLNAVAVFATHYHELSDVAERLERAVNGSMGIREWEGELVFLRSLEFRPAESSHGIFVARMAGLPKKLLSRATDLFSKLESAQTEAVKVSAKSKRAANSQLMLALSPAPAPIDPRLKAYAQLGEDVAAELTRLKLDEMSPKQAWLALEGIVEKYARSELL